MPQLDDDALNQLFRSARTANAFTGQQIPLELIQKIYALASMGPTSMNCQPSRYVFLTTPEAKARLIPALLPGNRDKTISAPVTVIIATDTEFYRHMPDVWHQPDVRAMFENNPPLSQATATRNGTLGGAYFIVAARAMGIDCGPMSGFDKDAVNREFFPDGRYETNFLCNIGYADVSKTFPRNPRLSFEDACKVL